MNNKKGTTKNATRKLASPTKAKGRPVGSRNTKAQSTVSGSSQAVRRRTISVRNASEPRNHREHVGAISGRKAQRPARPTAPKTDHGYELAPWPAGDRFLLGLFITGLVLVGFAIGRIL